MNSRQERDFQVADIIHSTALRIQNSAKLAFPAKRIFPKRGKYRIRREIKRREKLMLVINPIMAAAQVYIILSQPIPRGFCEDKQVCGIVQSGINEPITIMRK